MKELKIQNPLYFKDAIDNGLLSQQDEPNHAQWLDGHPKVLNELTLNVWSKKSGPVSWPILESMIGA